MRNGIIDSFSSDLFSFFKFYNIMTKFVCQLGLMPKSKVKVCDTNNRHGSVAHNILRAAIQPFQSLGMSIFKR